MTIGVNLRTILTGGALSLALALAPAAARADDTAGATNGGAPGVWVCNEAGMSFYNASGTLAVQWPSDDPNVPARHKDYLHALPGHGVGLVNAAANSPALALCGDANEYDPNAVY